MAQDQLICRFAAPSDYKCNCPRPKPYIRCGNTARLVILNNRSDGAAFHSKIEDDSCYVRSDYCNNEHCLDFVPMKHCKYATFTPQKWAGELASCKVVECRNPDAQASLKTFKDDKGNDVNGVRRPCHEDYSLIPNADFLQVRSRFCNEQFCQYYTATENS